MKKLMKVIITVLSTLLLNSCQKESAIDANGQISPMIAKDLLFEKLDQATYDTDLDMLKYGGEKINKEMDEILKKDIKNKKVKSYQEFYARKEKMGNKDFEKRFKNKIKYAKAFKNLMIKYPELETKKLEFMQFFISNRRYKISAEQSYNLIKQNKS